MNPNVNPFKQGSSGDNNEDALDIMRLINQLTQSPSIPENNLHL